MKVQFQHLANAIVTVLNSVPKTTAKLSELDIVPHRARFIAAFELETECIYELTHQMTEAIKARVEAVYPDFKFGIVYCLLRETDYKRMLVIEARSAALFEILAGFLLLEISNVKRTVHSNSNFSMVDFVESRHMLDLTKKHHFGIKTTPTDNRVIGGDTLVRSESKSYARAKPTEKGGLAVPLCFHPRALRS